MSMDREGRNTSPQAIELLRLLEDINAQNQVDERINSTDDDKIENRDEQVKISIENSAKTISRIVEIQASDLDEIKLKATAVLKLVSYHDYMHELDRAIEDAKTYDIVALSLVRDILRFAA